MSRKRRNQEQIDKIKEEILQNAYEIFKKKGFVDGTIDEIAERMNIAKGTIYNYFKSKKDLIISILIKLKDELLEKLKSIIASMEEQNDFNLILESLIDLFFDFQTEHKNIFVIFRQKHFWARELKKNNLLPNFKKAFKEISELLVTIIDFLKEKDIINKKLDSIDISLYFLTIFKIPEFKEFILERDISKEKLKQSIKFMIFNGISK